MAFYIESRFVDIRTLVDFSEFNEADYCEPPPILDTPVKNETTALPIQSQEALDNSQALEQVTKIIIENENKPLESTPISENGITTPIANEPVLLINPPEETKTDLPSPTIEVVDKTSLYAKYINQKYEKEVAAEFIKLLLNPFIIILAYRYEFLETSDNSFSLNLRHLKNVSERKLPDFAKESEASGERDFQTGLLEYNRKRELDRKMPRK